MNEIYLQLREESRRIISTLPGPKFCRIFFREITYSRQMLYSDPLLIRIKKEINPIVEDDFGHGMRHSDLVCVDAGAIIQIEMGNKPGQSMFQPCKIRKKILLVQVAGLLHDVKRKQKKHAEKGAEFAKTFLSTGGYPFSAKEINTISIAIKEHEAFSKSKKATRGSSESASLISNALYDADKFRWGADNFTHTVWDMVTFLDLPAREFIRRYPDGMATLAKIKSTFRTKPGQSYGPDFINIGIEAGNRLFKIIKQKFPGIFQINDS